MWDGGLYIGGTVTGTGRFRGWASTLGHQMTHPNPLPTTPGRAVATDATGPPYPHSLLLGLGTVTEEEESSGKEEHAPQDDDEGAEHEGVAQTQELPERGVLGALADQVRDLRGGGTRQGRPTSRSPSPTTARRPKDSRSR